MAPAEKKRASKIPERANRPPKSSGRLKTAIVALVAPIPQPTATGFVLEVLCLAM